jgi:DNA-binding NarL/FixJ family response regulator
MPLRIGCPVKRLLVVAEDSLLIEAIALGLRKSGEFSLLGHVDPLQTSSQAVASVLPDVVLIDDMDESELALQLIREIKSRREEVAVIVLALAMQPAWLDALFDAGASGVVSKATPPLSLATVVRETIEGHVIHMHRSAAQAPGLGQHLVSRDNSLLTTRELEVLRLVAAGSTNGEIARRLWVTEQTVKFHLSNVYRKLQVGNRTEASYYAHVNGLLGDAQPVPAS